MATKEKQIEELRQDLFYVNTIVIDDDEKANVLYDLNVRKVVLCDNCYMQGSCIVEDTFNTARMADSMKFCAVGKPKTDGRRDT
ncbi:MAG: hypothetical protein E7391_04155 [Ruminococcaceae bacterium]|nr:hypothetical protein [Oscillospiraceae bacterium]